MPATRLYNYSITHPQIKDWVYREGYTQDDIPVIPDLIRADWEIKDGKVVDLFCATTSSGGMGPSSQVDSCEDFDAELIGRLVRDMQCAAVKERRSRPGRHGAAAGRKEHCLNPHYVPFRPLGPPRWLSYETNVPDNFRRAREFITEINNQRFR